MMWTGELAKLVNRIAIAAILSGIFIALFVFRNELIVNFGNKKKKSIFVYNYRGQSFYTRNEITNKYEYTGCLSEKVKIKYTPDTLIVERPNIIMGYKPLMVNPNNKSMMITKNYAGQNVFFIRIVTKDKPEIMYICDGNRMVILCQKDSCIMFKEK